MAGAGNRDKRLRGGKPTLHDLAAAAGVSTSLASIVMRDAPGASDATRRRVKKVAQELGYQPDLAARFLRRGRTRLIGVAYRLNSPYLADVVRASYSSARKAGYDIVLGGWFDQESECQVIETLLGSRAAALVLIAPTLPSETLASLVDRQPVVTLYVRKALPQSDSVTTDEHLGMRLLIDHLVALGHRAIAHADGGPGVATEARRIGFLDAMRAHGLDGHGAIIPGGETLEAGVAAAEHFVASGATYTAIASYNDESAHGLIDRLAELGLSVPRDLSVTGFDAGRYAHFLPQHLTTVRQDHERYAEVAVRRVTERLEHSAAGGEHVILSPALVVGRSTKAIDVEGGE